MFFLTLTAMINNLNRIAAALLVSAATFAGSPSLTSPACIPRLAGTPAVTDTPKIQVLTSGTDISIRGLCVVNDDVVWVSGSKGKVGRSIDGGATWQWTTVAGFEKRDFRDIEAFDEHTAVIIAIAEPGNILRTTDGGQTWTTVFTDTTKGMFLDAMAFADNKKGIVVGDPIDGKTYIATTKDGGKTWAKATQPVIPAPAGDGFFAASGTNVVYQKNGDFTAVSGGKESRLLTPAGATIMSGIIQGREMTGANSIVRSGNIAIVVAGDYENNKDTTNNCIYSHDNMKTWQAPVKRPNGYRSCVAQIDQQTYLTCGTAGIDITWDAGKHWQFVAPDSYHVCQRAKKGKAVFLAGGNGRIARLVQ